MYVYTDHAKRMMKTRNVSRNDVKLAVENGEVEFMKNNEKSRGTEYYHSIELKKPFKRKIVVGWTYEKENIKIITVYEIKRKGR